MTTETGQHDARWLTHEEEPSRFVWTGDFETRHVPKAAGMRWDGAGRHWWTDSISVAARLARFADDTALPLIDATAQELHEAFIASSAADADIEIPCREGLSYLGYQRA